MTKMKLDQRRCFTEKRTLEQVRLCHRDYRQCKVAFQHHHAEPVSTR